MNAEGQTPAAPLLWPIPNAGVGGRSQNPSPIGRGAGERGRQPDLANLYSRFHRVLGGYGQVMDSLR
ncbi:MAG: hypothetical protein O3A14_15450 [Cyanobacteria bacterium]|nr:hypothetical protein [Cyanobacteriota bacterium]